MLLFTVLILKSTTKFKYINSYNQMHNFMRKKLSDSQRSFLPLKVKNHS